MRLASVLSFALAACGPGALGPPGMVGSSDLDFGALEAWCHDAPASTVPLDKAAPCAATFGSELTSDHGRFDAVVTAVVTPADSQCPMPNGDHVVLQALMHGAVYRMVINVLSTGADARVRVLQRQGPLLGGPWAEGWHAPSPLDYPTDLQVHAGQNGFTPTPMSDLVPALRDAIRLGGKVSVFTTSSGGGSAHLIHRNGNSTDGALVLDATSANPTWWLFHFADQTF